MKILILITKSDLGGAQLFALNLAKGLRNHSHEVVVAGGDGDYLPNALSLEKIEFHKIKNLKRGHNPFYLIKYLFELRHYIKSNKFDIIHFNSTNALLGVWGLIFLHKNPKKIFTVHGLSILDNNHFKNKFMDFLYRFMFKLTFKNLSNVIFVSKSNYENAIKMGIVKDATVIYNGVVFPEGYFLNKNQAIDFLENKTKSSFKNCFLYGSIGRLAYQKNYEFLIKLHNEVKVIKPNAKLILIGDGPYKSNYQNLIKELKLEEEVFLFGSIKDASRYLKAFDLFVLPSIFEGLSFSLIEAVYSGVPTISSKVGGNEEVIGVENCFKLNNREEFLDFIKNENKIKLVAKTFDYKAMIDNYLKIYEI